MLGEEAGDVIKDFFLTLGARQHLVHNFRGRVEF
jgi:hypothetical protein